MGIKCLNVSIFYVFWDDQAEKLYIRIGRKGIEYLHVLILCAYLDDQVEKLHIRIDRKGAHASLLKQDMVKKNKDKFIVEVYCNT